MSNMVVQTNVLALNSHRYMKQVGNAQSKSSARLSSGYKINSAADDAAGLAISEKMRAQIRGLDQASKNAQDGISLIQTAEGGMQEIDNMLQRIRELVVSVSNDTNENNAEGTGDRQKMQDEIDQLVAEIDSMSERVEFNKKKVINGSYADTALQLKNAKAEYDRASLSKVETNAKLAAYKDALGVSKDASSATGTTAYSRLNAAQDAVDAGVTPYKDALKTFTAAEVTFTEAQKAYQTTQVAMEAALTTVNKEAKDITNAMLDKNNAAYLGDDFARAFVAYQEASNAWGIEDVEKTGFDKTKVTAANVLTNTAFTGVASEDAANVAGASTALAAYNSALEAAKENPSIAAFIDGGGIEAKQVYDTATTALNAALTAGGLTATTLTGAQITANTDVATALEAYVSAANTYGYDGLGVSSAPYMTEVGLPVEVKALNVDTTATPGSYADTLTALDGDQSAAYLESIIAYEEADPGLVLKDKYDDAVTRLTNAITGIAGLDFSAAIATDATTLGLVNEFTAALDQYTAAANAWGVDGKNITALTFGSAIGGTALGATISIINTATGGSYSHTAPTVTTTAEAGSAAELYAGIFTAGSLTQGTDDADVLADIAVVTDEMAAAYKEFKAATDYLAAAMEQVLGTGAGVADLTNVNVGASATLQNALSRYATAANAWGAEDTTIDIDGNATADLDFDAVTVDAKYKPSVTTSAVPTASLYESLSAADKTTVDGLVTKKDAIDTFGAYAVFQAQKEVYTAEEATYNDLIAKRDTAQKTVNDLTTNVENTEKEKLRSDILYNVANQKLNTAKNAVEADDSQALYFQVGANATQGLEMSIGSVKSDVLGIGDGNGVTNIDVVKDTGLDTTALLDVLDTALSYVTTERSRLGAAQNRLEYTIKSLDISSENLSAAESRIRDTDMAKEMMELTKANTLQQASISMLAQANQAPQSVLQLLG